MKPVSASLIPTAAGNLTQGRYRIGDGSFTFAAAHHLVSLADTSSKTARPHGHTFTVEVELADTVLRTPGFVADYAELAPFSEYLKRELDHRDLNTVFAFDTTADALAQHFTAWFLAHMAPELGKQLRAIRVTIGAPATSAHRPADDVSWTFQAAHHLEDLPAGHKCGRPHGHSYRADLRLTPQPQPECRTRLRRVLTDYLEQHLDHRDLNTVLKFQPTSELLAKHLYACILDLASPRDAAAVRAVRVWESPRRWAEFTQDERSSR